MENPSSSSRGLEENILAILDSSGFKQSGHLLDDRLAFLEAVRTACLFSQNPWRPTWKISNAVFQILRDGESLELTMASYELLISLDERYPRIKVKDLDDPPATPVSLGELVVKEAWSPFAIGSEVAHGDGEGPLKSHALIDSKGFSFLVKEIAEALKKENAPNCELAVKILKSMLLLQYLVEVLEADFSCRHIVYRETLNWDLFKESILFMLLVHQGSRQPTFKNLVGNCMSIIQKQPRDLKAADNSFSDGVNASDTSLAIAAAELEKGTRVTVQKLLTLIFELDVMRKQADAQGLTLRVEGVRRTLVEIILEELMYNKSRISPFLEGLSEPNLKLEIILQYLSKYCITKPSVRTRRSRESPPDGPAFEDVLSLFSAVTSAKAFAKRINLDEAQLLIAHAFQAYLSAISGKRIGGSSLSQICSGVISAFQSFRKIEDIEMTFFEKQAIFAASTILSRKS